MKFCVDMRLGPTEQVESHILSMFEDKRMNKLMRPKKDEAANDGEKSIMKSFVIVQYISHQGRHIACTGK
jgi:hypothetical protein